MKEEENLQIQTPQNGEIPSFQVAVRIPLVQTPECGNSQILNAAEYTIDKILQNGESPRFQPTE